MSFIAALDAELEALQNVLAADPTFVKWRELQRIRGLYSQASADEVLSGPGGITVVQVKPTPVQQAPSRGEADAGSRGRRPDPSRSRAVQEAETIIRAANGDPVPTSDILEELQEQGIAIPGERPLNNLSAMLSNSGLFTANGRRGWTLKQESSEGADGQKDPDESLEQNIIDFNDDTEENPTEITTETIKTIADYVAQTMDPTLKSHLRRISVLGEPMPDEVEKKLEETARRSLHRSVDTTEMISIRSAFVKSLFHRERGLAKSEVNAVST